MKRAFFALILLFAAAPLSAQYAPIQFTITGSTQPIAIGPHLVTYTVTNTGATPRNVSLDLYRAADIAYPAPLSATFDLPVCTFGLNMIGTQEYYCNLGTLNPGESFVLHATWTPSVTEPMTVRYYGVANVRDGWAPSNELVVQLVAEAVPALSPIALVLVAAAIAAIGALVTRR